MGEVTVTVTFPVRIKPAKPEVIAESVKRCTTVMLATPRGTAPFRFTKLTPEDISVSYEPTADVSALPSEPPTPIIPPPCNLDVDIASPLPSVDGAAEVVADSDPPWDDGDEINNIGTLEDATEKD